MDNDNLKVKMLRESKLILDTVDFLSRDIDTHLFLFERAYETGDTKEVEKQEGILKILLEKLSHETENMNDFMRKYTRLVNHEKEKMLYNPRQKKQIPIRGVSPNSRRKKTS